MGMVHEKPGWWTEPGGRASAIGATLDAAGTAAAGDRAGRAADAGSMAVISAQVRPMGPNSRFTTRPMAYACLNCGEWIHPGAGAWHDPDRDESVCASCWPESVVTRPRP